jgi:hypothetical protein
MCRYCIRQPGNSRPVCRRRKYRCCWHCPVTSSEPRCATRWTQRPLINVRRATKLTEKNQTLKNGRWLRARDVSLSDARDARFRKLCNEHASTSSRKGSAIRLRVWDSYGAARIRIRLVIAVGGVDERTRLRWVDDGTAWLSVQRNMGIGHQVDSFERVDLAARGPVWRLRPECGPYGALRRSERVSTSIVDLTGNAGSGSRAHINDQRYIF